MSILKLRRAQTSSVRSLKTGASATSSQSTMSDRGRSHSPKPLDTHDEDVDMENGQRKPGAKVVVVNNLTRNVFEAHLRTIFGFYGEIAKLDLPLFAKSGQNRGRASLEFATSDAAHLAFSHMNGGQLDGAVLKVELSDAPIRTHSRSRSRGYRNGRSPARSHSRSPSRGPRRRPSRSPPRYGSYRGRGGGYGRRGPPGRDVFKPHSRSRSRSKSPHRRGFGGRMPPRRRSPSYERGGTGYGRRSRSYSDRYSSRSRSRSYSSRSRSYSRSRSRSRSPRSYSSYSRSRSRSRSLSRGRRSHSRDDIRDSRSRSRSRSERSMSKD